MNAASNSPNPGVEPGETRSPAGRHLIGIALAAGIAHAAMLTRGLVWDDRITLEQMNLIGSWRLFEPDAFGFVRPGKMLMFSILKGAFGERPLGWEAFGLVSVVAASLLLYRFAREFLSAGGALAAALIYAVHPLHVEGAGWLSANNGTLLTILALGYYIVLLRDARKPGTGNLIAQTGLFAAALLMKEEAVVVPVIGALILRSRGVKWRRGFIAAACVQLALAGAFVFFNRWKAAGLGQSLEVMPFAGGIVAMSAPRNMLSHALYFAAPFRWGYYTAYNTAGAVFYPLMIGGLGAAAVYLIAMGRSRLRPSTPLLFVTIGVLAILPASNLIPLGNTWFGVRYLTHAGIGLALLAGWAATRPWAARDPWRRPLRLSLAAWLLAAAVFSNLFHRQWRNEDSLFVTFVEFNDNHYFNQILAGRRHRAGRYDEAEYFARRAIELEPESLAAIVQLGMTLEALGRTGEAVAQWRRAEAIEPLSILMAINMATYHEARFERGGAAEDLEAADRYYLISTGGLTRNSEVAYINRGRLWVVQGGLEQGIAIWEEGLAKFPNSEFLRRNLARARADLERHERAKKISSGESTADHRR